MKIIFITSNLSSIGGIQRYNKAFLEALGKSGCDISIVELKNNGIFSKILFAANFFIRVAIKRPDLVICSHINFAGLCYFAKKIFKSEYLITLFGIEARTPDIIKRHHLFKEARTICTVSEFTIEKLILEIPEIREKIAFLENPIDGTKFMPKEKNQKLIDIHRLKDKKVILTVSRLSASEKYKGYDRVLESISLIKKELPELVYLIVGDGDDRQRVEGMIKHLNLVDSVILVGFVSEGDLVDYYNLADVFVMPSKFEGFGFVFSEALACGVPVIAGNKDGSVAPLLWGKLGTLVDPDNTKEIGDAIKKILLLKADKNILDSKFLRDGVLAAYGLDVFENKVKKIIHGI